MSENRRIAKAARDNAELIRQKEEKERILFGNFFADDYIKQAKVNKTKGSYQREEDLFDIWIKPVIGNLPFREISVEHLEKIKLNMFTAERSPRSVRYALAVVRQVFNYAIFARNTTAPLLLTMSALRQTTKGIDI